MSAEDTFRRVLTARLPSGPGWTAWIDGAVHELAASVPTIDRDALAALMRTWTPYPGNETAAIRADQILALLRGAS